MFLSSKAITIPLLTNRLPVAEFIVKGQKVDNKAHCCLVNITSSLKTTLTYKDIKLLLHALQRRNFLPESLTRVWAGRGFNPQSSSKMEEEYVKKGRDWRYWDMVAQHIRDEIVEIELLIEP